MYRIRQWLESGSGKNLALFQYGGLWLSACILILPCSLKAFYIYWTGEGIRETLLLFVANVIVI